MQARGGGDNKCGRTSDFGGEFLSRVTMECQFHLGLDLVDGVSIKDVEW